MNIYDRFRLTAPEALNSSWGPAKRSVVQAIDLLFDREELGAADVARLDEFLTKGMPDERRRAQRISKTLAELNALGILKSALPTVPLPIDLGGTVPKDPRIRMLAGSFDNLVSAVLETAPDRLDKLGCTELAVLTFFLLVIEGPACPSIAVHSMSCGRRRDLRGGQWLWIPSSPAARSAWSALFLRDPLRKLVRAWKRRCSNISGDTPLFMPAALQNLKTLDRPARFRALTKWLHEATRTTLLTAPADRNSRTSEESALETWRKSLEPDVLSLVGSWRAVEQAARYRWSQVLPQFVVRVLFSPVQPAAPDLDLIEDKVSGRSKRSTCARYSMDAGKPPRVDMEPFSEEFDSAIELDPTESIRAPSVGWAPLAASAVRQFLDSATAAHDHPDRQRDFPGHCDRINQLRNHCLDTLRKDFPDTSLPHMLIRWTAERFKRPSARPNTLRSYLGRFGPRYLFTEDVPADLADWTTDDVFSVVSAYLGDGRAASTAYSAVGLFAEFVHFVRLVTSGALLAEVRIVRIGGDLDFERRTAILSEQKVARAVAGILRSSMASPLNRTRAALAITLMSGVGLRAIEAFSLRKSDVHFCDGHAYISITKSKTVAGHRRLSLRDWLNPAQFELVSRLYLDIDAQGGSEDVPFLLFTATHSGTEAVLSYGVTRRRVTELLRHYVNTAKTGGARQLLAIDLHSLRHGFATRALLDTLRSCHSGAALRDDGAEFVMVLAALGHRSSGALISNYFHGGEQMRKLFLDDTTRQGPLPPAGKPRPQIRLCPADNSKLPRQAAPVSTQERLHVPSSVGISRFEEHRKEPDLVSSSVSGCLAWHQPRRRRSDVARVASRRD